MTASHRARISSRRGSLGRIRLCNSRLESVGRLALPPGEPSVNGRSVGSFGSFDSMRAGLDPCSKLPKTGLRAPRGYAAEAHRKELWSYRNHRAPSLRGATYET